MTSLSKNARVAGLLYILSSLFGIVRLIYVPNVLFVHGNAAATASNIAASVLSATCSAMLYGSLSCWRCIGCLRESTKRSQC
jgi:hypothetical protein